jgi:hypothetical protein
MKQYNDYKISHQRVNSVGKGHLKGKKTKTTLFLEWCMEYGYEVVQDGLLVHLYLDNYHILSAADSTNRTKAVNNLYEAALHKRIRFLPLFFGHRLIGNIR